MGWLRRGRLRQDALLAAVSLAGGLLLLSLDAYRTIHPPADTPRWAFAGPLAVACGAVLLRRVATRTGLALGTAAAVADLALGGSLGTLLVYTQVLYDSCVYGSARLWRWLLRVAIGGTVLGTVGGVVLARAWQGMVIGVLVALIVLLPVLTGTSVRQYRDQAAADRARAGAERARAEAQQARAEAERARAEQTARLAELDRRQAVAAERTRMARELHDVVANHLSAVAIHATAALSLRQLDRAAVHRALEVIRSSSVQGLAEMRRMIELLRDADEAGAGLDPPGHAGLDAVDDLVARARDAGLAVELRREDGPGPLPAAVGLTAYRILQESLTNALKHGGGSAEVTIGYAGEDLVLTVDSPLRDHAAAAGGAAVPVPGAGAGLLGMRERADLLAGRLSAGPVDGRWRVRARLPR